MFPTVPFNDSIQRFHQFNGCMQRLCPTRPSNDSVYGSVQRFRSTIVSNSWTAVSNGCIQQFRPKAIHETCSSTALSNGVTQFRSTALPNELLSNGSIADMFSSNGVLSQGGVCEEELGRTKTYRCTEWWELCSPETAEPLSKRTAAYIPAVHLAEWGRAEGGSTPATVVFREGQKKNVATRNKLKTYTGGNEK